MGIALLRCYVRRFRQRREELRLWGLWQDHGHRRVVSHCSLARSI